jgi:restriction-modification enzyme MmeI-like protein
MQSGNKPTDNGNFILTDEDREDIISQNPAASRLIRRYLGSKEIIQGGARWCLWIEDDDLPLARSTAQIWQRIKKVGEFRARSRGSRRTITVARHTALYSGLIETARR